MAQNPSLTAGTGGEKTWMGGKACLAGVLAHRENTANKFAG